MSEGRNRKDDWAGAGIAWSIIGTLLAGMAVWGGAGWLVDHFAHSHVFLPVGLLVGILAAMYLVIVRYGRVR